ncbi:HNH endonuclease signature motif containing protein [Corynebacterium sp.]|uniref:HNH endonuclease signature motif containing protein n=1 Tax=Corynebacterium sp. TaxID=1720 RepID=UPI003734FCE6
MTNTNVLSPTPQISTSPLAECTNAEIIDTLLECEHAQRMTRAEFLVALEQFHTRNLHADQGASSTVAWVCRTLDLRPKTAYEYINVAVKMVNFPLLVQHFRRGDLSYSVVRFLLKYITHDNEAELVDLALKLNLANLEHALAGHEPNDGPEPEQDYVRLRNRDDGGINVHISLNPADAAAFLAALKIGELSFTTTTPTEDADINEENQPEHLPSRFGITPARAMLSSLQGMINIVRNNPGVAKRAPGAQVNIMMTQDGHAFLPFQPKAVASKLANIAGNAIQRVHLLNDKGLTLNVSRSTRFASDAQQKALLAAWNFTCATPGCDHTNWIEFHHIREWCEGGETSVDNIIPLCSRCHSLVTEGIMKIEAHADDIFFVFPDDTCFVSRNRGLPERTTMEEYLSRQTTDFGDIGSFDDAVLEEAEGGVMYS